MYYFNYLYWNTNVIRPLTILNNVILADCCIWFMQTPPAKYLLMKAYSYKSITIDIQKVKLATRYT